MSSFQNNGWCGLDSVSASPLILRNIFLIMKYIFSITRNILGWLLPVSEGTEDILIWSHIFFFEAALVNIIRAHCARHATHVSSSVMIIIVLAPLTTQHTQHTTRWWSLSLPFLTTQHTHAYRVIFSVCWNFFQSVPEPGILIHTSTFKLLFRCKKKVGPLIIWDITLKAAEQQFSLQS